MPGKLVSKISKRKCFTLNTADTVKTASSKLHENHIGCMPILNENQTVVGIVSERDYKQLFQSERFNSNHTIDKIMTKNLFTCDLNTSVTELMEMMTEKKIRHILIMEDNKLLGVVSIGDVVNHLIDKYKEENKSLRDYINSY